MSTQEKIIPFNRPYFGPRAQQYIQESLVSGKASGDGGFTKRCHALLEEQLSIPKALLTTSCTHALEMAAILLDIEPGDEVIVPSFTFVSTVNAFVLRGAKPIFCDVRPDTLNLDEQKLESLFSPKTRAVVPVHYAGVGCEMDTIMELCNARDIAVVEDNAHGLYGKYKGQWLGTFGALATQSFHETKNFACGEGGALLINDSNMIERSEIIREKGTNRSRFFRGQVDKYTWVDIGSSYLLSDILAATLLSQFETWEEIQQKRAHIWNTYQRELLDWCARYDIRQPMIPEHCEQSYHMFYLLFPDLDIRQRFIHYMRDQGVWTVFHYLPLHLSEYGMRYGGSPGDCPVTEDISDRLVRLPMFFELEDHEIDRVIEAALAFSP